MRNKLAGWSLIELLTVLVALGILVLGLWPVLARAGSNTHSLVCLNNLRQLIAAMSMYSHENLDLFPPNPDTGSTVPGYNWCTGIAGVGGSDEFNSDLLKDPARSLLAPYVGKNASLFKCPADARTGKSTASSTLGQIVPAARTISMNQAVGTDPFSPKGRLAVNGPWLDGAHSNSRNGPWFTYAKITDVVVPSPRLLYILLDEDPLSLNDASFAVSMVGSAFIDWPATHHNFAGSFAFADGRAELHKWKDPHTVLTFGSSSLAPNADVPWLQARTSAHR